VECLTHRQISLSLEGELPPREAVEVREHLETCAACQQRREVVRSGLRDALVSSTATAPSGAAPQRAPVETSVARRSPAAPLEHGTIINRYTILDRLGSGGMGVVYAAYDPKLDRRVALKFLTADKSRRHATMQTRFLREAQAMAHLSHPNVINVHDVGTFGDDVFIAMEFIDGSDLKHWVKDAPRSWQEVVKAMVEAGRGLAAAHKAGLIHRDIKPSNILVGRDGRVRVMDFGLARSAESPDDTSDADAKGSSDPEVGPRESALDVTVTQAGSVMGTPQYMAPEQRRGTPVDARADQFSFCVTLYRALFDQFPFNRKEQHRLALGMQVKPADPPADRPVPARLKRVIYRGMSLRPEDRYPDLDALLDALTRRQLRFGRRALLIAAGAVAAIAAVTYPALRLSRARVCAGMDDRLTGIWDDPRRLEMARAFRATGKPYAETAWQRAQAGLQAYASQWVAARTQACEATLVRREASDAVLARRASCLDRRLRELETVATLFAHADGRAVDTAVTTVEALTPAASCLAHDRPGAPSKGDRPGSADVDALRSRLGQTQVLLEAARFEEVRAALERTLPDARRAADPAVLAQALRLKGQVDFEAGQLAQARDELQEAEWTAESAADPEEAAATASALITVSYRNGQSELAHLWANHARALLRAEGGDEGLESDVDVREAAVDRADNLLDRAQELGERALSLRLQRYGNPSARVASAWMLLSGISSARGDDGKALDDAQRAASIFERAVGPDHPDTATARGLQGAALVSLGRCAEAMPLLESALKARLAANPSHPFLGLSYWDLGNLYRKLGDEPQAVSHYATAQGLLEKHFGAGHRFLGSMLADRARLLLQQGDARGAQSLADQAVHILTGSSTADFGGVVVPLTVQGDALLALGQAAAAGKAYRQAVEAATHLFGAKDRRLAAGLTGLAEVELAQGHPDVALTRLDAAQAAIGDQPVDPAELARTHLARARALLALGHPEQADAETAQARRLAMKACNPRTAGAR